MDRLLNPSSSRYLALRCAPHYKCSSHDFLRIYTSGLDRQLDGADSNDRTGDFLAVLSASCYFATPASLLCTTKGYHGAGGWKAGKHKIRTLLLPNSPGTRNPRWDTWQDNRTLGSLSIIDIAIIIIIIWSSRRLFPFCFFHFLLKIMG